MVVEVHEPTTITVPMLADPVAVMDRARAIVATLYQRACAVKVFDAATAATGAAVLTDVATLQKSIKAQRLDLTRPIDAYVGQIIAAEKEILAPLAEAEKALKAELTAYQEAERAKVEAEAKAKRDAEIAAAKAEAEAQRAIAERERQARELAEAEAKALRDAEAAKAKAAAEAAAQAARKAAQDATKAKDERAKEAARIALAMAEKDAELAALKAAEEARIAAAAEQAAREAEENAAIEAKWLEDEAEERTKALEAAPIEVNAPRVAGFHTQTRQEITVTDLRALCGAIAAGSIPDNLVKADMAAIKAALKLKIAVPGLNVSTTTTGVAR